MNQRDFKVYRFKTIKGTFIYVGFSHKTTEARFCEHSKEKEWINEVAEVEEILIENEACARLIEMYYINKYKPIRNYKDKFDGDVTNAFKLDPKYKKFSHAFYTFNGQITTCVPSTIEGHILVDFITIDGNDIGIYYDNDMNSYYSATDLAKALDIKHNILAKEIKDNDLFLKTSYNIRKKGQEQEAYLFLCKFEGIKTVLELSKNKETKAYYNSLLVINRLTNINDMYEDKLYLECVKDAMNRELRHLEYNMYEDINLTRRLIYKALHESSFLSCIVEQYNRNESANNKRRQCEILASETFSMFEDISNEYGVNYKDVANEFANYLLEQDSELNLWKIRSDARKFYRDDNLQTHFVIAIHENILQIFEEYYEYKMDIA